MGILDMKLFRFLGFKKKPNAPWRKYYKKDEMNIKIPDTTLYRYFRNNMKEYPNKIAFDYYGTKITYKQLRNKIDECARAFLSYGIRKNDVVTICMPNTPEGIISFLALNKIGAISNMLHPLSSENEIFEALKESSSVMLVTIDLTYSKIKNIIKDTEVYKVVIVRASDSMPFLMKMGYKLTEGYKTELPKHKSLYIYWKEFILEAKKYDKEHILNHGHKDDPAVMLHSGGSTGNPKAIVLSNANFIVLVKQAKIRLDELEKGDKCLSIMPIFHGFGLGVCVYTPLCVGAQCILIPRFKPQDFDKLLNKYKPEFIIGVPTLFEALMKNPRTDKLNLNYLKYVICGGDTLAPPLEKKINEFLFNHGSNTCILQGYGMSETLVAVSLSLKSSPKLGSVGIPWPGCYIGIFSPDDKPLPPDIEGEICISGPNVMMGYYDNEKETNAVLHIHDDGNVWLHSGDLGKMDKNGFLTYTNRIKRLIVSSGYNVYPNQIEAVLETHPAVMVCSVIGIPHPYKVEVPKAYIVLNNKYKESESLINELKELCKKNLSKHSQPYEYEFRKSLPKTMVGKVDFKKLQEENIKEREKERNAKKEV